MNNVISLKDAPSLRQARNRIRKGILENESILEDLQTRIILPENADKRDSMTEMIISVQKVIGGLKRDLMLLERRW